MDNKEKLLERQGLFLKDLRERSGLTQLEVAKILNCTSQAISGWEVGRNSPRRRDLQKLMEIYHADIDQIKSNDTDLYNYMSAKLSSMLSDNERTKDYVNKIIDEIRQQNNELDLTSMGELPPEIKLSSQLKLNSSYHFNSWIDIPLFDNIRWNVDLKDNPDIIGSTKIPSDWFYHDRSYFALKVKDDKNYPVIRTGDILITQSRTNFKSLKDGSYIIFQLNGSEARIGRFDSSDGLHIYFENDEPIEVSVFDNFKLLGVIRELRRNL